ncbi:NADH-quinone oxidoreductase subunit N, partial [Bacillus paralicheniformis]|nr:NADH-quinone oxidoreductase subunit N [Bacillus paralicheniformis]
MALQPPTQAPIDAPQIEYAAILPILILLGAACIGVLVEAFVSKASRWAAQVTLSLLSIVAAGVAFIVYVTDSPQR